MPSSIFSKFVPKEAEQIIQNPPDTWHAIQNIAASRQNLGVSAKIHCVKVFCSFSKTCTWILHKSWLWYWMLGILIICGCGSCNPFAMCCKHDLTHWGRATHICVSKLTIIGSDNGLSPERRHAIIWTNAGILLIGPLGTNFSEILI